MAKQKVDVRCCFEEWDREHHCMGTCKKVATHKLGNAKLCEEHALYSQSVRLNLSKKVPHLETL